MDGSGNLHATVITWNLRGTTTNDSSQACSAEYYRKKRVQTAHEHNLNPETRMIADVVKYAFGTGTSSIN
jgi:hypothetical protein